MTPAQAIGSDLRLDRTPILAAGYCQICLVNIEVIFIFQPSVILPMVFPGIHSSRRFCESQADEELMGV